jgi:prophage maintenance system killer protein
VERLSGAELLYLHARLVAQLGGPRGVRDVAALRTALAAAASVEGGLFERAAQAAVALAQARPFHTANEALALAAALLGLRRYGLAIVVAPAEMAQVATHLARGEADALATWLRARARPLDAD